MKIYQLNYPTIYSWGATSLGFTSFNNNYTITFNEKKTIAYKAGEHFHRKFLYRGFRIL